jgi:hypothetical protein
VSWEFLKEIALTVALFDGQQGFFQFFLPWLGLMFKLHRITPFSVVREVKRGTLSENFHVQGRIPDARNAGVNSNEISVNFELRITPIR